MCAVMYAALFSTCGEDVFAQLVTTCSHARLEFEVGLKLEDVFERVKTAFVHTRISGEKASRQCAVRLCVSCVLNSAPSYNALWSYYYILR